MDWLRDANSICYCFLGLTKLYKTCYYKKYLVDLWDNLSSPTKGCGQKPVEAKMGSAPMANEAF